MKLPPILKHYPFGIRNPCSVCTGREYGKVPRENKQGLAWEDAYRKQRKENGKRITPVIVNVGNFPKPVGETPSLLSLTHTLILFHEFGHALHDLLSESTFSKLSGTSVPNDFVAFPSQLMENWALEPDVMKMYAKHYQAGEIIPDDLIEKISKSNRFRGVEPKLDALLKRKGFLPETSNTSTRK